MPFLEVGQQNVGALLAHFLWHWQLLELGLVLHLCKVGYVDVRVLHLGKVGCADVNLEGITTTTSWSR